MRAAGVERTGGAVGRGALAKGAAVVAEQQIGGHEPFAVIGKRPGEVGNGSFVTCAVGRTGFNDLLPHKHAQAVGFECGTAASSPANRRNLCPRQDHR